MVLEYDVIKSLTGQLEIWWYDMDYEKIMLKKVIYLILVLIVLVIVGVWTRKGSIDSDIHTCLVVDLSVMLGMIIQDITSVWKLLSSKDK